MPSTSAPDQGQHQVTSSMPPKVETVSKDSGVDESLGAGSGQGSHPAPRRTTSQDSSKSKQSQATTAPSISEYPKPPERKKRTGIRNGH